MPHAEIVVVDQSPDSAHGRTVRDFLTWVKGDVHSARYVPAPDPPGSAPAKERAFAEASGEVVLCIDSHVLMHPGSLAALLAHYEADPDSKDMLVGPMVYDDLEGCATHLHDEWRGEQWGTWAEARRCRCGAAVEAEVRGGRLEFRPPDYTLPPSAGCPACGNAPEPRAGVSVEASLAQAGFTRMTRDNGLPFPVWAHGTGLMACRKEAWPGFAPGMRGFGAEEVLIHGRFRRNGGRVLCHPRLRWTHRFLRPEGPKYSLSRFDKVRNFVVGFRDLGLDPAPVHAHFVAAGLLPADQWEAILAGAESPPAPPPAPAPKAGCKRGCGEPAPAPVLPHMLSLEAWHAHAHATPHDINEHVPTLRELASQCRHVTEFGMRHGISTVALLAGVKGNGGKLVSHDVHRYPEAAQLEKLGGGSFEFRQGSSLETDIEETDLLFIDTVHTERQLSAELARHHAKAGRWIVLHDTAPGTFGERGEDGGPGLLPAVRAFLKANPGWSVVRHHLNNNGLMVLSRDARDKKPLPSSVKMAWNFASALAKHAAAGGTAPEGVLKKRLEICTLCESRNGDRCGECGCFVEAKAGWLEQECPSGRWASEGV